MKKTLIAMSIIMTACAAYSSATLAATGTINFTGEIVDATCEVAVNGSTGNPTTINLGKVDKATLDTDGKTSAAYRIEMELTKCPDALTEARARFSGAVDDKDNRFLKLTQDTGVAQNVAIEFTEKNDQTLPLGANPAAEPIDATTHSATLLYFARYHATGAATAGPANAVADYTVVYN
ncbi:S-fimbrillin [Serratia ficaria]|uniref:fimbrial protein n=1 Tax=Serratia ficaria TaxID=61651 RepID=UPI0021773F61|nr:fimbrial protein [Serratia ficaria]CAI1710922.1 S-fimbrillin [Serratia ficaria]